jgi:anti-sigma factor (TIGR02949 family)
MVRCRTIIDHLSEYMDGEASPELRRTIENHLRHCRRCSAVYDSTRQMLVIVGDKRTFEVPTGFSERLHRFIDDVIAPA